jgi:dipeptidyl aminopeptidase/acylaminoacyl peptidase
MTAADGFDVERYLNVRSAYGASVAPDGRIAFLYDATGVPQVWTLDAPGAWPVQRTVADERVTFVDWSPERAELIYGMDRGGNERVQLYLLDPDGGPPTNLTQRPGAKHRWGGWDPDGDRFAFAANRRDEAAFDVYVQDRDATSEDARLVHETDGWFSVAGWSPDGDRLALVEARSSFDQDVYVLDLAAGERTHLTPHEGDVRYGAVEWGPDGEGLYVVTDRATDTLRLERVAVSEGTHAVVVDGGDREVDGVSVDRNSGRLVYSRNVDGYTELTVGRLTGPDELTETAEPSLPDGVAGGVAWGPEGDWFVCSASGRADNTDVYAVEAATGETTRWTRAATAGIPPGTFVEPELVRYETFDGRSIPAFLSLPDDVPAGKAPVVVDVHGGPESQRRPSFAPVTQYLLSRGYAVFEPNVRGSSGYGRAYAALDDVGKRMDAVADLRAGAAWLADHPAVDPDRIAVMGASYGGFMTLAALTTYPDVWAAGVDVVGIANFVTFLENTGSWRRSLREAEYGSLEEDRELLADISPINRMDRIAAPLFVLHGENDPRVPVEEAHQVVEAAAERDVPVRELVFDDEGHGFSKLANRVEAYTAVVEFLDEHV